MRSAPTMIADVNGKCGSVMHPCDLNEFYAPRARKISARGGQGPAIDILFGSAYTILLIVPVTGVKKVNATEAQLPTGEDAESMQGCSRPFFPLSVSEERRLALVFLPDAEISRDRRKVTMDGVTVSFNSRTGKWMIPADSSYRLRNAWKKAERAGGAQVSPVAGCSEYVSIPPLKGVPFKLQAHQVARSLAEDRVFLMELEIMRAKVWKRLAAIGSPTEIAP